MCADLFWSWFRGGVYMSEPWREDKARVVVVGKVAHFARLSTCPSLMKGEVAMKRTAVRHFLREVCW